MGETMRKIYPTGSRDNYNLTDYADIAVRNYVRAKEQYKILDFSANGCEEDLSFLLFDEYTISCIVFSTMCIEAFLNDYAASCLGDDEFYGYFDKLSIEGKFALIVKFILCAEIDKSKSYYYRLKRLVRDRNRYAHSKSKYIEINTPESLTDEEYAELLKKFENLEIDRKPYLKQLDSAKNGICAMRDIALLFDEYDAAADAVFRLFCCGNEIPDNSGKDVRDDILKELQIENMVM